MSFAKFLAERRRGVILRALCECAPGTEAAADLLQRYCVAIGLRVARDEVDADLRWLGARHLVVLGERGGLLMAACTQEGRDVAMRLATVPGVDMADTADS